MDMIAVNDFAKRHIKKSSYSYFDGTWKELVELVNKNFSKARKGYRDGVILVPVPEGRFYTSMCRITKDSVFKTTYEPRQEGEEPVLKTVLINGEKTPAKYVNIVLYRHDVLAENNENTTNAEWEIISINASLVENEPMHPMTMARNMLEKKGGTKAEYTGEQFAEALWFWKDYLMFEES